MPRKVKDLLRTLKDDGWRLVAQKGSHRQCKHPTKPGRVTISGPKETPNKSLRFSPPSAGLFHFFFMYSRQTYCHAGKTMLS
ncbi:MAG: type II toxin-antitoxin system HicA family toxin [Schwartzia sp.]|nr:type II toxin-antitoxin system HicA family toxin [Schwartzia sp. (in: firmicutes)]